MPRERNGNRKMRKNFPRKVPDLGYYFIVTDTEETEKNYLYGLRDSLPEELQGRIVIKVSTAKTGELVAACEQAGIDPQYRECWIVFDRDRVVPFDKIIEEAERKGIQVGWSNPCIEIWFAAYFGKMPAIQESVACCHHFANLFERMTGREYKKSNQQIYSILNQFGDEEAAIQTAENRLKSYLRDGVSISSKMCPGTTIHRLVNEIRGKTSNIKEK